jgi:hypothetical protein
MKIRASLPMIVAAIAMTACSNSGNTNRNAQRERERDLKDRDSVAFKAGEAAHEIAKHAEKAAVAAARELEQGVRKASEGWKEKEREDREKARNR